MNQIMKQTLRPSIVCLIICGIACGVAFGLDEERMQSSSGLVARVGTLEEYRRSATKELVALCSANIELGLRVEALEAFVGSSATSQPNALHRTRRLVANAKYTDINLSQWTGGHLISLRIYS